MNLESTMQSIGLYCERVCMLQQCGQAVMNMRLRKVYGCSFEPFHAQEQLYMPYYCNLSHDGLKLALWCREFVSLYKDRNLCISKTRGGRRRWCQQLKCLCFCFPTFLLGFFLLVLCFYVLHTHVQHNAFCLLGKQFCLFSITLCQRQIVKISRVSEQDLLPLWRVTMLAVLFLANFLSEFFLHFWTSGTCGLIRCALNYPVSLKTLLYTLWNQWQLHPFQAMT